MSEALLNLGASREDIDSLSPEQVDGLEKMGRLLGKSVLFLLTNTARAMRNGADQEPQDTVQQIVQRAQSLPARPRERAPAPEAARPATYRKPDDGKLADITWLQMTMRSVKSMRCTNLAGFAQQRFSRGTVRAAMAALLTQVHGKVASPQSYVFGAAKKLREGETQDVRGSAHFHPQTVWGKEAFVFAGVESLWPAA